MSKKSILAGGLLSSAGILISKILGLIYVIPFNTILGSSVNNAYYASAYNIYSYILNIAVAGLPFAISTLIAKYATREDYKMCLVVKKISFYTMATIGFIAMALMILLAYPIALQCTPNDGDVLVMKNVIIIISIAVFIVPILASIRGFFNGIKEMEIYSMSQVFEQLIRILFLLSASSIAVYIFHTNRVWAVYFGVMSAAIAGMLTIFFVKHKGKLKEKEIIELAKKQEFSEKVSSFSVFKELIVIAIPFLMNSIFGYSDTIINMFHLKPGLDVYKGMEYTSVLNDAIFYKTTKIIAIPMILAPGFSAAIIPYITSAKEEGNNKLVKKYILECIESVIYIALPICFALYCFARPIMQILFGGGDSLNIDTFVLQWFSLEALCSTVVPIFASIGMSLEKRNQMVFITFIFALIKFIINYPLICLFGVPGMIISSAVAYIVFGFLIIRVIQKEIHIQWKNTLKKIIVMLIGILGFYLVALLFNNVFNIFAISNNRIVLLLILAFVGILSCLAYLVITEYFNIPQSIFHIKIKRKK